MRKSPTPVSEEKKKSQVRIVFLGSGRTGKTSIIKRFVHDTFQPRYQPTVEDIFAHQFIVCDTHLVDVELMDTSGYYNFPAMRRLCISRASALVLVFTRSDPDSFEEITKLYEQAREARGGPDFIDLPLVVVENKLDLLDDDSDDFHEIWEDEMPNNGTSASSKNNGSTILSIEAVNQWKRRVDLHSDKFVEASAKTGEGIYDVFRSLWQQNEASQRYTFDQIPVTPTNKPSHFDGTKRRFSAFAVLSGSSPPAGNLVLPPSTTAALQTQHSVQEPSLNASPSNSSRSSPRRHFMNKLLNNRRFSTKIKSTLPCPPKVDKPCCRGGPIKLDCVIS